MFLDDKTDKTIYVLVNDYSVKAAFKLFKTIYETTDIEDKYMINFESDFPCLEDLYDVGIIYKDKLYNLSELSKVGVDQIFYNLTFCKKHYKGNTLLRNTIKEFQCSGV